MRRIPALTPVACAIALVLLAPACGVFADDTAATVGGRTVSIESVEELAGDEGFVGAVEGADEGRVPGDLFRSVLAFEIERVAWVAEAERWGLEITDADRQAARSQVEQQMAATQDEYEPSTVRKLEEYVAAQTVLSNRFAELDPEDESDLRRLYDGAPSIWDRICVAVTRFDESQRAEVDAALAAGTEIEDLREEVPGTELLADPAQQCIAEDQLSEDLREAFTGTEPGETGHATVDDGMGGEVFFVFRVDDRASLSFEEARDDLVQIVQNLQQAGAGNWIALIVRGAEVNPRFGSGVTVGANGRAIIEAPPAPLAPTSDLEDLLGQTPETAP